MRLKWQWKYKKSLKNKKTNKYYFIAGEASGDLHGGNIIKEIKKEHPHSSFLGIGGPKMEKEGMRSIVSIEKLAVLGFWEVFKNLSFFLKLKKEVVSHILKNNPDKVILIDYPGFNLKIAQELRKHSSVPIVYYISPQLWAWKENRLSIIKKNVSKMIVLFPFEKEWYLKRNFKAYYFGHPLMELHANFLKQYKKNSLESKFVVGLFPGSRKQELKKHLPLYKSIVKELNSRYKNIFYIIKLFNNSDFNAQKSLGLTENFTIENKESFYAFHDCDFAVVASGTATLECAITNTPMAVIYKTSWLSWFIAKLVLRIKFVSIVNILNNKEIVKEFLQNRASAKKITDHIVSFMHKKNSTDYSKTNELLYKKNIYKNTSMEIIK